MSLDLKARQNAESMLRHLAAQRKIYGDAKRVFAVESLLASLLPVLAVLIVAMWPEVRSWFSFILCVAWCVGFYILEPHRKRLCALGAAIQEQFDVEILRLPPSDEIDTSPVNREQLLEAAEKYLQRCGDGELKSWYPESTDSLPTGLARVVCQRSNLWWDADVRSSYARMCRTVLALLLLFWVGFGILTDISFRDATFVYLVPLAPILYLFAKQARSNDALALRKFKLITEVEALWCQALNEPLDENVLAVRSRKLQNDIYRLRTECDLVWDWLYSRTRKSKEKLMSNAAEDMVRQAMKSLAS